MVGTAVDVEVVVAVVGRSIAAAAGKASAPAVALAVADSGEVVSLGRCPLSRLDSAGAAASAIS